MPENTTTQRRSGRSHRARAARSRLLAVLVVVASAGMAACTGPAEQRAEHLQAGWGFIEASNFDKARVEFANALKIEPKDAEARFGAGKAAEGLRDYRAALGHYQSAVDAQPKDVRARVALGRLLFFAGALDEASKHVDAALAVDGRNAEAMAVRGALTLARGDAEGARRDVDAALAIDPDNTYALSLSSSLHVRAGNTDAAVAELGAATQRRPDDLALRRVYAELFLHQNRPAEAVAQMREIVRLQPDVLEHRLQLAELFARMGDAANVEATLRAAVAALPDDDDIKLALVDFMRGAGRAEDARRTLEGFVAANDSNLALQTALGRLHGAQGRMADAVRVLEGVVDASSEGVQGMRARVELARVHLAGRDVAKAKALVDEVLEGNALDAGALGLRATMAMERKAYADAIADLRSALRDAPDDKEMLRLLARAYAANGERPLAMQTLETLVARAPEDVDAHLQLADLHMLDGKPADAVPVLRAAIAARPNDARPVQRLAQALVAAKEFTAAGEVAKALLARKDTVASGHYFQGLVADAAGDRKAAEAEFRASLALEPRGTEPLSRLVAMLTAQKRIAEARAALDRALARAPDHAVALQLLGELELQARAFPQAVQRFEAAIRAQPGWWLPYRALALAARAQGDLAAARAAYTRGIRATDGTRLLLDLAALEVQAGDANAAMALFRRVLEREPGSLEAANNLAMLLVLPASPTRAALDEALSLARKLERSTVPAHLDTLGWVHFRRGEHALAAQYLQRAVALAPDDGAMRFHLAAAQKALAQHDDARKNVELALRAAPFPERGEAEALLRAL